MKYLASSLAVVLLATPALAQSIGEKTGVNSTLGISPTTEDFVKEAVTSDIFEIAQVKSRKNVATHRRNRLLQP